MHIEVLTDKQREFTCEEILEEEIKEFLIDSATIPF